MTKRFVLSGSSSVNTIHAPLNVPGFTVPMVLMNMNPDVWLIRGMFLHYRESVDVCKLQLIKHSYIQSRRWDFSSSVLQFGNFRVNKVSTSVCQHVFLKAVAVGAATISILG